MPSGICALLRRALTHSSAVRATSNNERLEFLGDRVLGLVVADMLLKQFPEATGRRYRSALQRAGRSADLFEHRCPDGTRTRY